MIFFASDGGCVVFHIEFYLEFIIHWVELRDNLLVVSLFTYHFTLGCYYIISSCSYLFIGGVCV